jgi:hypothetical protein
MFSSPIGQTRRRTTCADRRKHAEDREALLRELRSADTTIRDHKFTTVCEAMTQAGTDCRSLSPSTYREFKKAQGLTGVAGGKLDYSKVR